MKLGVSISTWTLLACGLCLAATASAADLTGRWVAEMQTPDGEKRQSVFNFKSEGDSVTGYLSSPMGDTPIQNGKMTGDTLTFEVVREMGGEERITGYSGKLTPEGLLIKMPGFGDRPGRELLARRVSTDAPKPFVPPPPKILETDYKEVPYNGLAKTPPMGWNSWNKFARRVDDKSVREMADAMAKNGMRDAGYVYVNIDDTWQGTRDEQGNIRSNEKFPDMKALAAYVHGKGLKLGIYSSPGPKTCAGFEGSYQHEEQDARTFAAWGIDYLKYDWCSARTVYENASMPAVYAKMGRALAASGRPIVYSLCQYGMMDVGEWGGKVGGNLWRTTGDIRDTWQSMADIGFDKQNGREKYAGPGHWNDPDMLEIGNDHMIDTEYRTHMSLWSLLASPLLAGNDLRNVSPSIMEILTNKEVIAVDQDALGKQARRISKTGDAEIWARPLADGSLAVGLFNRGADSSKVTAKWDDLGLQGPRKVRDLWAHADRGSLKDEFSATVPSHGVVMVKISR